MRVLMLVPLLLVSAASPAAPGEGPAIANRAAQKVCTPMKPSFVREAGPPKARRLGELPDGKLVLSVVREVDGCIEPVIVRQGYGRLSGR